MRLFLAVFPDDSAASKIGELLQRLKTGARFADAHPAWVRAEQVHITLRFLGNRDATTTERLAGRMDALAANHASFSLSTTDFLFLPPAASPPRVLALSFGRNSALRALRNDVEQAVGAEGVSPETRDFKPHLTLARIKSRKAGDRLRPLVDAHRKFSTFTWQVRSFGLYQSVLKPDGPEYKLFREFVLAGNRESESEMERVE